MKEIIFLSLILSSCLVLLALIILIVLDNKRSKCFQMLSEQNREIHEQKFMIIKLKNELNSLLGVSSNLLCNGNCSSATSTKLKDIEDNIKDATKPKGK